MLLEYVSRSKGFASLFCRAGSLFKKAVYNIFVPLHFPKVGPASKVTTLPETLEMDQLYKWAPDGASDPGGVAWEESGAVLGCWGKG